MIIHRLTTKGMCTALRDELTIDFNALGPGLLALVGANQCGKSHLMELMCGATLYREYAYYNRETLISHVPAGVRDAFSDLEFSIGGARYRCLVRCDPGKGRAGKTEAYLYRGDGSPLAGPNVTEVDAAVAKILPPRELILASAFNCQGGGYGLFSMERSARRALFVEMLGIEHLQAASERANEWATARAQSLGALRDRMANATERRARAETLAGSIAAAGGRLAGAQEAVEEAQAAVAAAKRTAQEARGDYTRAEVEEAGARQEVARIRTARDEAAAQRDIASARLTALDGLLEDAATIEHAANEVVRLDGLLAVLRQRERETQDALGPLQVQLAEATAKLERLRADHEQLSADLRAAQAAAQRVAHAATVEADAVTIRTSIARLDEELGRLDAELPVLEQSAAAEAEALQARAVLEDRRQALAARQGLLARIPGVPACGECVLTADAREAATRLAATEAELEALPAPTQAEATIAAHRKARQMADHAREEGRRALRQAEATLAGAGADRERAEAAPSLAARLTALVELGTRQRATTDGLRAQVDTLRADLATGRAEQEQRDAERHQNANLAQRLEAVHTARGQRGEMAQAVERLDASVRTLTAELAALPVRSLDALRAAVADTAATLQRAEEAAGAALQTRAEAEAERARLEGERAALGDPAADLERLVAEERTVIRDVADWRLLQAGLGPTGVQALELDAASPAVAAIANDILWSCFTARYSIQLVTTEAKQRGGEKETFCPKIIDAENGGRPRDMGSGGEQAIFDSVVRLALAIVNGQRSGHRLETLWLDESSAPLNPENADLFVAMLRRTVELGRFRQVFFVSHAPEIWRQADVRLHLANGRVTVNEEEAAA